MSHMGTLLQLGPNVTIGKNVVIGPGVRIRESLVLEDALIQVRFLTWLLYLCDVARPDSGQTEHL